MQHFRSGVWIQRTGMVEWNGMVINKLDTFDWFSPLYRLYTSEQRPPVNKDHPN